MLPVMLYNNMEGGSNQLNNSLNSSFGLSFDDSVILNSVRTRKKVTEQHNCPVCSCTIRQGELESHMALEVDRLTKLSSGGTKRKLSSTNSNSGSSSVAIAGSSSNSVDVSEDNVDVTGCLGSDVYQRVHNNRLRRLRLRARRVPAEVGACPVCEATLSLDKLQKHALRCLKRTGADVDEDLSSSDESIDVENDGPSGGVFGAQYEWCGETRVRASALLERAPSTSTPALAARRHDCEGALVVDGDEDTELYGPAQYSPSRIAPEDESQSQSEADPAAQNGSEVVATVIDEKEEPSRRSNGIVEASAETRIQALKSRIRELESRRDAGEEAKCLICLAPHSAPAVSIQCWHVYCEECWLESLRAKKICPQCNAITTTQHLRRLYM